jgi:hypothetical protein
MSTAVLSKQVPIVRLMTSRAGPPWNRFTSSSAFPASRGRRDGLAFAVAVVVVGRGCGRRRGCHRCRSNFVDQKQGLEDDIDAHPS